RITPDALDRLCERTDLAQARGSNLAYGLIRLSTASAVGGEFVWFEGRGGQPGDGPSRRPSGPDLWMVGHLLLLHVVEWGCLCQGHDQLNATLVALTSGN